MQVILLKDIKNYGKEGDIITVSDGYGKNYLLPQKLAVIATSGALKINQNNKNKKAEIRKAQLAKLEKIKAQLALIILTFKLKGSKGKVTGAISAKQICERLTKEYNIIVDKHKFLKFDPINEFGTTKINIKLDVTIIAKLTIEVLEE